MDTTVLYVFMALSAILLFASGFSVGVNRLKLTKTGEVLFVVATLSAMWFAFYMLNTVPSGDQPLWYLGEVIVIMSSVLSGMSLGIFIHRKRIKKKTA